MKIFLDDVRMPDNIYTDTINIQWKIVRNYDEFVSAIKAEFPEFISFDHDLADEHYQHGAKSGFHSFDYSKVVERTGYDCAKWLCDYCLDNKLKLPKYNVHSFNPVGRQNIQSYLDNFSRHCL